MPIDGKSNLNSQRGEPGSIPRKPTEWCVITGAPGSGKTTLLEELSKRGYRTQEDAARAILEDAVSAGVHKTQIRFNEIAHRKRVVSEMIQAAAILPSDELVFLDYAIPDNVAFARFAGIPVSRDLWDAAAAYRYKEVFVLSPLPLNASDPVRLESASSQHTLNDLIQGTYMQLGYRPITVAALPLKERADFVIQRVSPRARPVKG